MMSKHEHQRPQSSESAASHPSETGTPPLSGEDRPRRKPYTRPAIIHELALETRAGSPLGIDPLDPFGDPFGLDPDKR